MDGGGGGDSHSVVKVVYLVEKSSVDVDGYAKAEASCASWVEYWSVVKVSLYDWSKAGSVL